MTVLLLALAAMALLGLVATLVSARFDGYHRLPTATVRDRTGIPAR
jgi:hypothetical protein